jgi:ADP-ribose pyrophosphatase YjhB (NUDIX family)
MDNGSSAPIKVGAGLFIVHATCSTDASNREYKVLLLKRSMASGNPGTWGLPGGNRDEEDNGDLYTTAVREATEEMGDTVPDDLRNLGVILTKRGKQGLKHYTVFVMETKNGEFVPSLNEEHTEFAWVDVKSLMDDSQNRYDLHPVVDQVVHGVFQEFLMTCLYSNKDNGSQE